MPLPRFTRLAATEQTRIVDVATRHIAERGISNIALNDLADEAGISRSALYNYFDGRQDLIDVVTQSALTAVTQALEPWQPQPSEPEFWATFFASFQRLRALLHAQPELRIILEAADSSSLDSWIDGFFADAVRLGLVAATNMPLIRAVTGAVIAAVDALELARPESSTPEELQHVLQRVWN
ncbi:TetR/AcrR family transcriptional regulator [Timonella sp. A28]|uniref:TetR/AcrR family transcriptional regulator n=1 Tax=Timonella sp. A28 TaxID=3442640 RepID=UPI003EB95C1D